MNVLVRINFYFVCVFVKGINIIIMLTRRRKERAIKKVTVKGPSTLIKLHRIEILGSV